MEQNIDIKENYIYQLDANLLEHLLLQVKFAEEPRNPDANENELPGIGGAINYIRILRHLWNVIF